MTLELELQTAQSRDEDDEVRAGRRVLARG